MKRRELLRVVSTIAKTYIGSGILFLPKAFSNGGVLFTVLAILTLSTLSGIAILHLVECRKFHPGSFGDIGERAIGKWGRQLVNISLVLTQMGFCCVYGSFVARNMLQVFNWGKCWLGSEWLWLLVYVQLLVFVPLSWIRNISSFNRTNQLGNLLIVGGLAGILIYCLNQFSESTSKDIHLPMFNSNSWALALGTVVYSFEGIGMVLPIVSSMSEEGRERFPKIMMSTLAGITTMYLIVGIIPYAIIEGVQGKVVQDAITLNLPNTFGSLIIVVAYCCALMFSFPLMLYPAIRITEEWIAPWIFPLSMNEFQAKNLLINDPMDNGEAIIDLPISESPESQQTGVEATPILSLVPNIASGKHSNAVKWRKNIFRSLIVLLVLTVSFGASNQLDNLCALVGSFACTPLAFLYPSVFHLKIIPNQSKRKKFTNYFILLVGTGITLFSTYQTFATWSPTTVEPCVRN